MTKVLRHGWCFACAKSGGDEDVEVARSDFYHDHDIHEDNVVVDDDHGDDGDEWTSWFRRDSHGREGGGCNGRAKQRG